MNKTKNNTTSKIKEKVQLPKNKYKFFFKKNTTTKKGKDKKRVCERGKNCLVFCLYQLVFSA